MIRKGILIAIAMVLLISLSMPAAAAEGAIRVRTQGENVSVFRLGWSEATGYRLEDAYGGGYLTFDDTLSAELAAWFAKKAGSGIRGTRQQESIVFTDLEEGLYLVRAEDDAFAPFLVTVPWDGFYWEVEVTPMEEDVPQTGDHVGSLILTMAASLAALSFCARRRKNC